MRHILLVISSVSGAETYIKLKVRGFPKALHFSSLPHKPDDADARHIDFGRV